MQRHDPPQQTVPQPADRRAWWGAGVLFAATALSLLNSTIVNVALPAMQRGLELSGAGIAWAMSGWALAYAIPLVPAGRLGDRLGHKRVFFTGVLLFTLASAACALAQNEAQLVAFRICQGVAGGLFYPAIAAMLGSLFAGRDRAKAFAIMGATIGVAAAIGPLLGGVILETLPTGLGWRAVFLINVPLGLVVLAGTLALLSDTRRPGAASRGDGVGLVLLTLSLSGLLVPLIVGQQQGWPLWGWLLLAAGALVLVCFLAWESRVDRRGGLALIPPRLLRLPGFGLPAAIGFVQFAGFVSIFYVLALLWETGLGRSALEMGLLTLPEAIGSIIGSWAVTRLLDRFGVHTLTIGSALMAAGIAGVWAVLALVPVDRLDAWVLALPLLVTGLGTGTTLAPTLDHAISAVPRADTGSASGIIATVQRLGNAAGLAGAGAVFFTVLSPTAGEPADHVGAAAAGMLLCTALTVVGLVLAVALAASTRGLRSRPS